MRSGPLELLEGTSAFSSFSNKTELTLIDFSASPRFPFSLFFGMVIVTHEESYSMSKELVVASLLMSCITAEDLSMTSSKAISKMYYIAIDFSGSGSFEMKFNLKILKLFQN